MENGKYTRTEKELLSEILRSYCYAHTCRSCPLRTDDGIRFCHSYSWDLYPDSVEKVVDVLREANYIIPESLVLTKSISISEEEILYCFSGEQNV